MSDTIFVTGASGQLGKLVIRQLLARGAAPGRIIAGTRSPEKLADLAATGIAVRRADFSDTDGLARAFDGAGTVLVISTDALDGADTRLTQHRNAVAAAVAADAGRIAYTSLPNPACSLLSFAPDHAGTERAIHASGLPYTIFRNSWYQENLLRSLPAALAGGVWHSAAQGGRISYAAREDIADAIAVALLAPTSASTTYTLTGDEALSTEEIAALVRDTTGKPLVVEHVSDAQFAAGLRAAGIPDVFVDMLVTAEVESRAGNLSIVTDHLASLIGRAPRRLAGFLDASRAAYGG
jgi:NAD(P)H dehydrogenase (quinone)